MDFDERKLRIWEYLRARPELCELRLGTTVTQVGDGYVVANGERLATGASLLCTGGTQNFARVPLMRLRLPYAYAPPLAGASFIALWSTHVALTSLPGRLKVAAGTQFIVSIPDAIRGGPPFFKMGLDSRGKTMNIERPGIGPKLIRAAERACADMGLAVRVDEATNTSCYADMSPSLSPYITRHKTHWVAQGLSGAGTVAVQPWFVRALAQTVASGTRHADLAQFTPETSLWQCWNPPDYKQTPLSSVR
jgi:hypothetical protein